MGYGLTAIFAIYFWCILFWAARIMLLRSMAGRYNGPVDALEGMGELMLEFAILSNQTTIILTAVIGSFLVGLITEYVSRRWS